MDAAETRVASRYPEQSQSNGYMKSAVAPQEWSGDGYLAKWLAPLRALAVAQLRNASYSTKTTNQTVASNSASDTAKAEDAEEAHRRLVRTHCCTQVANIEASSIVAEAARKGREITVDGWSVSIPEFIVATSVGRRRTNLMGVGLRVYDVATGKLVNVSDPPVQSSCNCCGLTWVLLVFQLWV